MLKDNMIILLLQIIVRMSIDASTRRLNSIWKDGWCSWLTSKKKDSRCSMPSAELYNTMDIAKDVLPIKDLHLCCSFKHPSETMGRKKHEKHFGVSSISTFYLPRWSSQKTLFLKLSLSASDCHLESNCTRLRQDVFFCSLCNDLEMHYARTQQRWFSRFRVFAFLRFRVFAFSRTINRWLVPNNINSSSCARSSTLRTFFRTGKQNLHKYHVFHVVELFKS